MSDSTENSSRYIGAGDFLYRSGLLFEMNRRVLHPLGLAMAVEWDHDLNEYVLSNKLLDYRDVEGGCTYSEDVLLMGEEKLWEFMEEFGVGMMQERQRVKGYIVQKTDIQRISESI